MRQQATCGRQPGDPTPEQIAAECLAIRETWTDAEHRKRSAWAYADASAEVHRFGDGVQVNSGDG